MTPLLYVVRMDVLPDYLGEFVKWYDTRHAPDLIGTGFLSCSAYHSRVGGPFICNVYEVPDATIFASDAYVQVRKDDRQLMDEVIPRISNHSNTIYQQELIVGNDGAILHGTGTRPRRHAAVAAPVVSTLMFDCPGERVAALREWFAGVEVLRQSRLPGFLRARLARQAGKHPLFPSRKPEWIVLTEWASLSEAGRDGGNEVVLTRYRSILPAATADSVPYTVAGLSATLLNVDAWTA